MTDARSEVRKVYNEYRVANQTDWYESRISEYSKADNQALLVSSLLIFGASVCGILGAADIARVPLGIAAAAFAALGAAMTSWSELIGFRVNVELYSKARGALGLLEGERPDGNAPDEAFGKYVSSAETILLNEVHTWAQKWRQIEEEGDAEDVAPSGQPAEPSEGADGGEGAE